VGIPRSPDNLWNHARHSQTANGKQPGPDDDEVRSSGHKPLFARQIAVDPLGDIELLNEPFEPLEPLEPLEPGAPESRPIAPIDEPDEEEVEQGRGSIFRLFGNLSWVILFALVTLYRACTG